MPTRPDLEAAAIPIAALPLPDAQLVLQEACATTTDALAAALEGSIRAEQQARGATPVSVPKVAAERGYAAEWSAALRSAVGKASAERRLDAELPALTEAVCGEAEEARERLAPLRSDLAAAAADVHTLSLERELRGSTTSTAGLDVAIDRERRTLYFLYAIEVVGVFVAAAAFFGVGDGPLDRVYALTWFQVLGLTLSGAIGLFMVTELTAYALRRLQLGQRLLWAGLLGGALSAIAIAVSLGVIRWSAAHSAHSLSSSVEDAGAFALLVLVSLGTIMIAASAAYRKVRLDDLTEARERIQQRELPLQEPKERMARLTAEIATLEATTRVPRQLRSDFEQGIRKVEEEERAKDVERRHRAGQALGAWRRLQAVPPELRPLVATLVFELRRVDGTSRGEHDAALSGARFLPRVLGGRDVALLLLALGAAPFGAMLAGCHSGPDIPDVVVACDGTGASPADVCTNDLLARRFVTWAETATFQPGAAFIVVTSSGNYGTTPIAARIVVPDHWASRGARVAWVREEVAALLSIAVPSDDGPFGGRSANKSDLLSLVSVASREAAGSAVPVELLLASDGWFVSLGMDTEARGVPAPESVLAKLAASELPWDLSVFSGVTACGFHHLGAAGGNVNARQAVWEALLHQGGAPRSRIVPSCAGLYPPVPAELMPPVEEDTNPAAFP